jgi:O-antigen ligase
LSAGDDLAGRPPLEVRLFDRRDLPRIMLFSGSLILSVVFYHLSGPFFFALVALFCVLLSLVSFRLSFFFLLFTVFLNGLQWDIYENITVRPDQVAVLLFLVFFVVSYFRLKQRYFTTPLDRPILFFLLLNLFSSAVLSPIPAIALRKFLLLALYSLFYFLTVNAILNLESEERAVGVLKIFFLISLSPMIFGLLDFLFFYISGAHLGGADSILARQLLPGLSRDVYTFRIFSTMHEPNIFGSIAATLGLVFVGFLFSDVKLSRADSFFFVFFSLTAILSILLSFTRSAWLSFFVGLILYGLFRKHLHLKWRRIFRFTLPLLAVFLVIALGIFVVKTDLLVSYTEKLSRLTDYKTGTGVYRLQLWKTVFRDVPSSWLLGHGTQGHLALFDNDETVGLANFPLDILHSSGVLGLLVFAWIQLKILLLARRGIRASKNPVVSQVLRILAVSFIAMWVSNFFICVYWLSFPWVFTALIVGFSQRAMKQSVEARPVHENPSPEP